MPVDFSGTWELEKAENIDPYLDSLGISEEIKDQLKERKVKVVVTHKGKDFKVVNEVGTETEGKIGQDYEQVTTAGVTLTNSASWDGDKLVVRTTSPLQTGKEHISIRELKDGKIIQTNQVNGGPAATITLKRVDSQEDSQESQDLKERQEDSKESQEDSKNSPQDSKK